MAWSRAERDVERTVARVMELLRCGEDCGGVGIDREARARRQRMKAANVAVGLEARHA